MTRLARQGNRDRLEVDRNLAPKSAADLAGDDLNLRSIDAENRCALIANEERTLRRAPDQDLTIGADARHARMRFDISLVHGRGLELAFDDDVGLGETFVEISAPQLHPPGDVCWTRRTSRTGKRTTLRDQIVMKNRRIGRNGLLDA
jgi:hypothetical protein